MASRQLRPRPERTGARDVSDRPPTIEDTPRSLAFDEAARAAGITRTRAAWMLSYIRSYYRSSRTCSRHRCVP